MYTRGDSSKRVRELLADHSTDLGSSAKKPRNDSGFAVPAPRHPPVLEIKEGAGPVIPITSLVPFVKAKASSPHSHSIPALGLPVSEAVSVPARGSLASAAVVIADDIDMLSEETVHEVSESAAPAADIPPIDQPFSHSHTQSASTSVGDFDVEKVLNLMSECRDLEYVNTAGLNKQSDTSASVLPVCAATAIADDIDMLSVGTAGTVREVGESAAPVAEAPPISSSHTQSTSASAPDFNVGEVLKAMSQCKDLKEVNKAGLIKQSRPVLPVSADDIDKLSVGTGSAKAKKTKTPSAFVSAQGKFKSAPTVNTYARTYSRPRKTR